MLTSRSKTTGTANKTKIAIALFLVLTITASLTLQIANAHTPAWTIPTWTYLSTTTNPIGVNQEVVLVFWSNQVPPTAIGAYGDRWTYTVEVTAPDGSKETLGPFTSDPVGSGWAAYTPTQVGTYKLIAKMAEKKITGEPLYPGRTTATMQGAEYINDTAKASESEPLYLIVQQEQIQPWPETPLPTQFWMRPINSANRNWACLAANWLAGAAQQHPSGASGGTTTSYSYGPGPESAHIMWAKPLWAGGVMDARYGEIGYQTAHYDGLSFDPPIILNGRLYYNHQAQPKMGWYCVDLYTGETLYFHNTTGPVNYALRSDASGALLQEWLSFGQILNYESPNEHGGRPYLWSTYGPGAPTGTPSSGGRTWANNNATWMMFDAWTGNWLLNVFNVSTLGTNVYGKDGSILYYNIGTTMYGRPNTGGAQRLTIWNSTRAIEMFYNDPNSAYPLRNSDWCWRPFLNASIDGSKGFSVNITISPQVTTPIRAIRQDEFIIGGPEGRNNEDGVRQGHLWCLSLKPGQIGTLLWNITYTPPSSAGNLTVSAPTVDPENGMFYFTETKTRTRWGYSLATGQQVWKSEPESPWNFYGMSTNIYKGMLLSTGYGGVMIAYDAKSGKILWNYTASQEGYESPYGNFPIGITAIADGKIYLTSSEHSPTQPLWRGSYLRCVDASNGVELWKCLFWGAGMGSGSGAVVADGYVVGLNFYDNRIYCFGKGPSATTVTASPQVSVHGNGVLIQGTVSDQCAGAKAIAEQLGYVNGVPAISDDDMQAWMQYLYEQQTYPTNARGVEVALDALDPNGNFVHIDTVTSDATGMFKKMFTPEVPGEYTIIASFAGSKSYYGSYAETAIGVEEAPPATAPPEYPQPIDPTWTIIGVGIMLLIAIILVGIWIKK
ncbi:MAG: PQQ-like beta-propeller repeat protein [Candidatus Bathyarchaeota archaeon]|nr:PQQ-like beta-propeller repeat protein [Candidatus Bathyarchaeota archaeon]